MCCRVLEVAGRTATEPFTIGHVAVPRALLVNRVLPLLNSGRASSLQGGTEWQLAHAWPPVGSKHDYSKQQVSSSKLTGSTVSTTAGCSAALEQQRQRQA